MKRMIVIAALLAMVGAALGQVDTVWTRTYNGVANNNDIGRSCVYDTTGYLIVSGIVMNNNKEDCILIKYNNNGDIIWSRVYGDTSSIDKSFACTVDKNNNIYITGSKNNSGDILTIKYSPAGDTIWTRSYASIYGSDDEAYGVSVDSYENVYIAGKSFSGSGFDIILIKYNSIGDTLWTRRYRSNGSSDDLAYGCAMSGDSIIYVIGTCIITGDNHPLLLKYNQAGDTIWSKRLPYEAIGRGCCVDVAGNICITGSGTDSFTVKYNSLGDTIWTRLGICGGNAIATDEKGFIYITRGNTDVITCKLTPSGNVLWTHTYDGVANWYDDGYGIATAKQDIYVTGRTSNGISDDIITIKYNQSGLVAQYLFNGNARDTSGYGNHGTEHNGVALTTDRFGQANNAYKFDGVDDYIDCGDFIDAVNIKTISF